MHGGLTWAANERGTNLSYALIWKGKVRHQLEAQRVIYSPLQELSTGFWNQHTVSRAVEAGSQSAQVKGSVLDCCTGE